VANKLFKYRTRYYLQRRAGDISAGSVTATDEIYSGDRQRVGALRGRDLQKGENILDSWSLMHACFARRRANSARLTSN
jgi:hypothetical protein